MTAAQLTVLARHPGDCPGVLNAASPRRPLKCSLPRDHVGGHVYVSTTSAPDRKAG